MTTACTHLWPSYRLAHQSAATQTGRMTGWLILPYTHIYINAPIQILLCTPETVRPFQTYLLQRVVSWCVLLLKCHVPSLASLLWASPWYRGSHPVNMFQVRQRFTNFPGNIFHFLHHFLSVAFLLLSNWNLFFLFLCLMAASFFFCLPFIHHSFTKPLLSVLSLHSNSPAVWSLFMDLVSDLVSFCLYSPWSLKSFFHLSVPSHSVCLLLKCLTLWVLKCQCPCQRTPSAHVLQVHVSAWITSNCYWEFAM